MNVSEEDQRPLLLIGPPGIGKHRLWNKSQRNVKLDGHYTITHHTRQRCIFLYSRKEISRKDILRLRNTMSEIIASVYSKMEDTGLKEVSYLLMKSIVYRKH